MRLSVRYVDGTTVETSTSRWSMLRADGIDWVDLGDAYRMQGQSIYWLRRQDGVWTVGGGTVGQVEEATATPDGFVHVRRPSMPDVTSSQVKLGWWLP